MLKEKIYDSKKDKWNKDREYPSEKGSRPKKKWTEDIREDMRAYQ